MIIHDFTFPTKRRFSFLIDKAIDHKAHFISIINNYLFTSGSDPCREDVQTCDANAACIPSGASYKCECKTGYSGDGFFCQGWSFCTCFYFSSRIKHSIILIRVNEVKTCYQISSRNTVFLERSSK